MIRSTLRRAAILAAAITLLAPLAPAQPGPKVQEVYLTEREAFEQLYGKKASLEVTQVYLDERLRSRVQSRLERRLFEKSFRIVRARREGELLGYAIVTEEIGKYRPITFVVGVTPDSEIAEIAVMVYREHVGNDVKRRRFLAQFDGKGLDDSLRLNRDIINISGATLSVRAVARGARKVLAVIDELLLGDDPLTDLEWTPVTFEPERSSTGRLDDGRLQSARYAMGTLLEMTLYGEDPTLERAAAAVRDEVSRLESLLSTYRPDSEISRVNRASGSEQPVAVSPDTFACVQAALRWAEDSEGAFDPTRIEGGHRTVRLDEDALTIELTRPGSSLDLGGIGKGYALDRAASVLEQNGVHRALLNFGGQILALDPPPGREDWIVAIRDPERPEEWLGGYRVVRASVSTSAAYERGDHIVDPRSGSAAREMLSATVLTSSATDADALSTALAVLGADRARVLFGERPETSLWLIDAEGRQWETGQRPLHAAGCR